MCFISGLTLKRTPAWLALPVFEKPPSTMLTLPRAITSALSGRVPAMYPKLTPNARGPAPVDQAKQRLGFRAK